jgi:hypothetical protein
VTRCWSTSIADVVGVVLVVGIRVVVHVVDSVVGVLGVQQPAPLYSGEEVLE